MGVQPSIIELGPWLETAPGQYLLAWEQARLDAAVVDAFGFHALQLGMPEVAGLRANRMPHRWVLGDRAAPGAGLGSHLLADFDALPFPNQSLDLVVLPHTLEMARDPHLTLAEVERVLVPEGRVVIVGFNPSSLWGLRQHVAHGARRLGFVDRPGLFLPQQGEFLGFRRVRDWLRLLSFEVEESSFGCYRPALRSPQWLQRWAWLDPLGARSWPVLGAVYLIVAVKRVRGMRLVGLARQPLRRGQAATISAPAAAAPHSPQARIQTRLLNHFPARKPFQTTDPN